MDSLFAKALSDLEKAREHVSSLEIQLAAAREQVRKLEAFREVYESISSGGKHLPEHGFRRRGQGQGAAKKTVYRVGSQQAAIEEASVTAIREAGTPLSIGTLEKKIIAKGIHVGGQRPRTVIASVLSRSRFTYYDHPHGWILTPELEKTSEEIAPEADRVEDYEDGTPAVHTSNLD